MGWKQLGKEYFKRLDRKNEETEKILQKTGGIKFQPEYNPLKTLYYENKTIIYFGSDYLHGVVIFCRFGIRISSGITICVLYE